MIALASGLAEALLAIHAAGVVHRDLKPANVLLHFTGPKVIDFGIAQLVGATSITATGVVAGSPAWMAPEQIRGDPITPAVDVFAWASTVMFAATARPPFGSEDSAVVFHRIVNDPPTRSRMGHFESTSLSVVEACVRATTLSSSAVASNRCKSAHP